MRGRLLAVAAILVLAVPGLLLAKGVDLYSLFPNLTLGSDPGLADYVYVDCAGITANTLTLRVHVVTDAPTTDDYLQGIQVDVLVTADQGGVTLDTTVATAYASPSTVNNWGLQSVNVSSNAGNPSVYPLQGTLGAVELDSSDAGAPLGPGDYVFATLKFNLSSPTNICCAEGDDPTLVTVLANGYTVSFTPLEKCCGPAVPTLSEWGLILFGVVLFGSLVWYLRRRPVMASA